jgi:ABC-type dipeptide/oligopeptide/nickel transport system permease subunit
MAENLEIIKGASLWSDAWKRLLKNKLAVFGLVILTLIALLVIIGPEILYQATGFTADGIPENGDLIKSFPPSRLHPMGTDEAGRDMLARVLQGGRISLTVGIISTIVSLIVGVSYGAVAGFFGGKIDNVMMRIVDMIYAIPYILIVIVLLNVFGGNNTITLVGWIPQIVVSLVIVIGGILISALMFRRLFEDRVATDRGFATFLLKFGYVVLSIGILGILAFWASYGIGQTSAGASLSDWYSTNVNQGLSQILLLFFALGLVSWLTMARVVRGQVLSLKNQEFILAAKATGVSSFGIIFRHLVPNTLGPVIVYATLTVPSVMLTEAFLSYLGLGVQAPFASWGSLAADGVKNIAIFPWQLLFPGLTMALTLFSLNFLGDGLRDALDPQTRKF